MEEKLIKARTAYNNNNRIRVGVQTATHGLSISAGIEFIIWIFSLFHVAIPVMAAGFIAGCMVPVIQHLLNKLDY